MAFRTARTRIRQRGNSTGKAKLANHAHLSDTSVVQLENAMAQRPRAQFALFRVANLEDQLHGSRIPKAPTGAAFPRDMVHLYQSRAQGGVFKMQGDRFQHVGAKVITTIKDELIALEAV
jgi:hypothetical protein